MTHFCQQVACMTCPQLPVWVPTASSGGMKRGYEVPVPLRVRDKDLCGISHISGKFHPLIASCVRLTICSVDWHLPPALRQHCGALDTRSQHHGLGLGRHFLFLLAEDAGEHLPLRRGGASVGADGDAHFHQLHGTAGGMKPQQNNQWGSKVEIWGLRLCVLSLVAPAHLSIAVTVSP